MAWLLITAALLLGVYIILAFKNGYRFPDIDKERKWKAFPEGSNPKVAIRPVENLYIANLQAIPGTTDYMVFFDTDSTRFSDPNLGGNNLHFAIMSNTGVLKTSFPLNRTIYYDDKKIVILNTEYGNSRNDSCEVLDLRNMTLSQQPVHFFDVPEPLDNFLQQNGADTSAYIKKHQNDFFRTLQGMRWFEETPIAARNDSRNRGYSHYTDADGKIYHLSDSSYPSDLALLAPNACNYILETSAFINGFKGANITTAHPPSLHDNDIRFGYTVGLGNPNGSGGGFYFFVNHTWYMYYTLRVGEATTSFKEEGPEKSEAYARLYQLNQPRHPKEPLVVISDNRIWHLTDEADFR